MSLTNDPLLDASLTAQIGELSPEGALVVKTAPFTGRSTAERFIVESSTAKTSVDWGKINKPMSEAVAESFFSNLEKEVRMGATFQVDAFAGYFPVSVMSTSPWHAAFARNMFREEPTAGKSVDESKRVSVFHSPNLDPKKLIADWPYDCAIVIDFDRRRVGIAGTSYAGEIKKSVFTVCNFHLPSEGVLPMHASANCTPQGEVSSVLFGLSGTGKTTLSAASDRSLIGDDEIIWTDTGLSNLEGGCYAKLIHLSEKDEPEIYRAVNRPGAILENVVYHRDSARIDFEDASITENTRGSYPIHHINNVYDQGKEADLPKSIVFLTADAFGALPAVARLDEWQAQYHFMSGYTAKVAGTEKGVTEPQATFSACFGAPFMPRPASCYAQMLVERARANGCEIWLLNTGWMKGGYGVSERYPIPVSRMLLNRIQQGTLSDAQMERHPIFGFEVPQNVDGLDNSYFDITLNDEVFKLADKFRQNFEQYGADAAEIAEKGGPKVMH